jgi:hypothetical protein
MRCKRSVSRRRAIITHNVRDFVGAEKLEVEEGGMDLLRLPPHDHDTEEEIDQTSVGR